MWAALHVHSQYSILDSSAPVSAIAAKAKEFGMPSVALTDHGNLHGAVDFYKACLSAGVKPLIGCELYVAPQSRFEKKKIGGRRKSAYHLTILAKNQEGYKNLCALSSAGYLEGFYYYPRVDKELLERHSGGLICLSGCLSSAVSQAILSGNEQEIEEEINWHHSLFKEDFYFELQRHRMSPESVAQFPETWLRQLHDEFIGKQERVNERLIELSKKRGVPLVATNDSHYIEPEDWQAHEILLNIQSGEPVEIWEHDSQGKPTFRQPNPKRRVYASRELYFKSPEQMSALFSDLPDALSRSIEIADKCDVQLDFKTKHYPVYIPPELEGKEYSDQQRLDASEKYLCHLCEEGLSKRYTEERLAVLQKKFPEKEPWNIVKERLAYELKNITKMGLCDYLLIVWDFINWAKSQGIPVGPGRGSGVGSIVLYLIGITDIEPLRFDLFFERFINPERISYPDIDVDICMDGRARVIEYTVQKYGRSNVAQIITFGTMKAKMSIKDVGRVLSVPLSKVNHIAKFVPEDPNMTLEKALEIDVDLLQLYQGDEDAKRVIDLGKRLEGSIRNTGIHAAGLIVCGEPLTSHIPICTAKDTEMAATQYSMKPVEAVGMLKIDFLGLKTLTSIQICCRAIQERYGKEIDWVNLFLDDSKTFQLLKQGKTLGVFQMESGGMQELARQLAPDRFEEIMAIGALYRPGPMEMIPTFIARKHGKEPTVYDHPDLENILSETMGIMVYQEQVMGIARVLAGYSLGEGDVLRKAMGKKDQKQMAKEREKFRDGAIKNGLSDQLATSIFDKMEKFAAYGFNKSHAAGYGMLTYVTAFLKANYPTEWMAALMTCDRDDLSKVSKFIREAQSMSIPMLPPDVNESGHDFKATEKGIRFAMSGIKGVGEGVVESILTEREANGPFTSFYDFFKRMPLKKVGKKVIDSLVCAGAFDFTGWKRDALSISIEHMFERAVKDQQEKAQGVMTLFGLMEQSPQDAFDTPPEVPTPWSKHTILKQEKELMGFYLTGHPMDVYRKIFNRLSCVPLSRLEEFEHQQVVRVAFIIESLSIKITSKTQRKFAILTVSDGLESFELPIWSDLYEERGELLGENRLLYAIVQIDRREESLRLNCKWFEDLTKVDETMVQACDDAYDRVVFQVERSKRFMMKKNDHQSEESTPKELTIRIRLNQAKMSQILRLKELMRSHSGKQPLNIFFVDHQGKRLADLIFKQPTGLNMTEGLKKELDQLCCIQLED